MARAVEDHWPPDAPLDGLVVTRYGHGLPTRRIEVIEASHPVPDDAGQMAARRLLDLVRGTGPEDLVIALISGGGSALLTLPAPGISLAGLRGTTAALLASGAPIEAMNTVRKHLSAIAGGRLATASRAPVRALIISDVTGDDPTHIASGPCAPDPTTFADALEVLVRHDVSVPPDVLAHLRAGAAGNVAESPKPGDPGLANTENRVIATAANSLHAAAAVFRQNGVEPIVLGDRITGEASEVGKVLGGIIRYAADRGEPWPRPFALISGGECTVTLRSDGGRGGRCTEFLLSLGLVLRDVPQAFAIAADTDGVDGSESNAGALLTPDSLGRAERLGLSASAHLARHDAYPFFEALDDLVITGPTLTNVNDFRAALLL